MKTGGLMAVYVDGETKTGKGAAGAAIAEALQASGQRVYYDVAGDFYRRLTVRVRQQLGLGDDQPLPPDSIVEQALQFVYEHQPPFGPDDRLGDLQRPVISHSVSVVGKFALAQQAGRDWWAMTAKQAQATDAQLVVLDGRNPRSRMMAQAEITDILPRTALDLYLTCEPEKAAQRVLLGEGIAEPSSDELAAATSAVLRRRSQDRDRREQPFIISTVNIPFVPGQDAVNDVVRRSWQSQNGTPLPMTILLDNTHLPKQDMLAAVQELALAAVNFAATVTA